jgi:hypothetical protein
MLQSDRHCARSGLNSLYLFHIIISRLVHYLILLQETELFLPAPISSPFLNADKQSTCAVKSAEATTTIGVVVQVSWGISSLRWLLRLLKSWTESETKCSKLLKIYCKLMQ